jgi:class 3 adenylate cyclase
VPARPPRDTPSHGTAIILFADIADSTALTERLGDAAFREKARALDEALRKAIISNGGTAIEGKLLGDGVLATFGAAREAIACAAEMHRLAAGAQSAPPPVGEGLGEGSVTVPLLLHVGIHAGDVIRESNPDGRSNVYGGAVNIAARVASEAAAGETLVSATVRELARTSAGVSFEDRGERSLKGVSEPVRVWAVRWRDER